jgi:hypothetical protein
MATPSKTTTLAKDIAGIAATTASHPVNIID